MDIAYWGDNEYDADHWDSDSEQSLDDDSCDGVENHHCHHLFFAGLPSRRKRAVHPDKVASSMEMRNHFPTQRCAPQGSQYDQARWLSHYFWNQNPMAQRTPGMNDNTPPAISDSESMYEHTSSTATRNEVVSPKLIAACHHISLEESIAFSTRPRIVVEADTPHRVVHSNGAYEVYFGYTARLAASSFQAPNVNSLEDFDTALRALFDPSKAGPNATLIMYPVLGAERSGGVPVVTHYLIEASNCILSLPKPHGRWGRALVIA